MFKFTPDKKLENLALWNNQGGYEEVMSDKRNPLRTLVK